MMCYLYLTTLSLVYFFWIVLAWSVSCSLSDTYDVTSTLRWCIASQYGLAPLHPLLFSVLLVVPGRALASVSPDGERSVKFCVTMVLFYVQVL